MNFLAHIYLSGTNEQLKIGNFIADAVKGKKYTAYPRTIQKGILLHRQIDTYTDTHKIVKKSVSRLFPKYRHYSTVIVDIIYDHFLAANWSDYHDIALDVYVSEFYMLLQTNYSYLPKRIQNFLPYMIEDNWLLSYTSISGIGKILDQMNHRTKNKSKMNFAVIELEAFYADFKSEFTSFFEELQLYTQTEIRNLHL